MIKLTCAQSPVIPSFCCNSLHCCFPLNFNQVSLPCTAHILLRIDASHKTLELLNAGNLFSLRTWITLSASLTICFSDLLTLLLALSARAICFPAYKLVVQKKLQHCQQSAEIWFENGPTKEAGSKTQHTVKLSPIGFWGQNILMNRVKGINRIIYFIRSLAKLLG